MKEENVEQLLSNLANNTVEKVRPDLAEEIKENIPKNFGLHKNPLGNINIIIDLRINKLAAAAAIIITMFLFANFFDSSNSQTDGLYQESRMLIKYWFGQTNKAENIELSVMPKLYEDLQGDGKNVIYYGSSIDTQDSNAVLMQWKISEGEYKIIFADLSTRTVNAEELIDLLAKMIQKQGK